jgi:hypothetical protein
LAKEMMPGPQLAEDAANLEKHAKKPSSGRKRQEMEVAGARRPDGSVRRGQQCLRSRLRSSWALARGPPEPDLGVDQRRGLRPLTLTSLKSSILKLRVRLDAFSFYKNWFLAISYKIWFLKKLSWLFGD